MSENIKDCIEHKLCSFCGACISVCPSNALKVGLDNPTIEDKGFCETCEKNLCRVVCPQIDIEEKLYTTPTEYMEIVIARSNIKEILKNCQDGGIASTLVYTLLEEGVISICAGNKEEWKPDVVTVKDKETLLKTLGSKYTFVPVLSKLHDEVVSKDKKIAVVGLPCQIRALHNMEKAYFRKYNVHYKIGILCTHNFSYTTFKKIVEDLGINIKDVIKVDINKGKMIFYTKDGEKSTPVSKLENLCDECCYQCPELYSRFADINIGSMGSPDGWNTVIIMSKKGKELFEKAVKKGYIEIYDKEDPKIQKGLAFLEKFAELKRTKAKEFVENNNIKMKSSLNDIVELFEKRKERINYYEMELKDIPASIIPNNNETNLYIEPKYCIGCRACEISCTINNNKNRIDIVQVDEIFYTPIKCVHCIDAPCIKACPEKALYLKNGYVVVDNDKCIGCKMCINVCPFGHPRIEVSEDIEISSFGLPRFVQKFELIKCDECIDRIENGELPCCYLVCPTDAINIKNDKIENAAKLMVIK